MKTKYILIFSLILFYSSIIIGQTYVYGTIKQDGTNCVGIFAKPNGNIAVPPSNIVFAVSMPDQGASNPSTSVSDLLSGMQVDVNNPNPYTSSGRRFYDFNIVQISSPPAVNWTTDNEYKIGKVCFINGTSSELVQVNDLASYGQTGFTDWYIEFQGPGDLTPPNNTYYASPGESTVSNGSDSYAETIAQITLPVQLISFSADKYNINSSILSWTTSSEYNNDYFGIERSSDNRTWENIGQVKAAGNSMKYQNYNFIDDKLILNRSDENIFYYRLRIVDLDGQYKYSEIRSVDFGKDKTHDLMIHPNPTNDIISFDLTIFDKTDGPIEITVYDMNGQKVLNRIATDTGSESVDLSKLPANTYNIVVKQGDLIYYKKVIKVD